MTKKYFSIFEPATNSEFSPKSLKWDESGIIKAIGVRRVCEGHKNGKN